MIHHDTVLLENLVEKYGAEDVLMEMKLSKKALAGVAALGMIAGVGAHHYSRGEWIPSTKGTRVEQVVDDWIPSPNFEEKVEAVREFLITSAKNVGYSAEDVELDPRHIVEMSERKTFYIPLLLGQIRAESAGGVTPRAKRTKSPWSIGSFDNGKNIYYESQNDAVGPYMDIMLNDYLQNGKKTPEQLVQNGAFVNYAGKRYATNPNYERTVRSIMHKVEKDYPCLTDKS